VTEIDLIPADYRAQRQREAALRTLAGLAGVVLLACLSVTSGFAYAAGRVHGELAELELKRQRAEQQRVELSNLQGERARLEEQWTRLQTLRGEDDVGALFRLIDRTLPGDELWFERWELRRAVVGAPAPGGPAAMAPAAGSVSAQMRIVGQARDHAALSRFVRALYESPEVRDVHLERTTLRRYTTTSVVAFELAVVLKGDA
jgi:Fimbrial assembly protein (PilN)